MGENLVPTQMPAAVLMDFESVLGFRRESNGGKYGDASAPSVVDLSVGRSGDGWEFQGSYENSTRVSFFLPVRDGWLVWSLIRR